MADASGLRAKYEQTCPDCAGTEFVEDHAQGDLICTVSLLTWCSCAPCESLEDAVHSHPWPRPCRPRAAGSWLRRTALMSARSGAPSAIRRALQSNPLKPLQSVPPSVCSPISCGTCRGAGQRERRPHARWRPHKPPADRRRSVAGHRRRDKGHWQRGVDAGAPDSSTSVLLGPLSESRTLLGPVGSYTRGRHFCSSAPFRHYHLQ